MKNTTNSSLSVLLVDDSDYKIEKVRKFLSNSSHNVKLVVVKDLISAQRFVEHEKFDLLLLDMQIPNRFGENEPQEDGGVLLLEELETSESLIHPTTVVAFTQYDKLQEDIREKYPELGAIKFDNSSTAWEKNLQRILNGLTKAKKINNKIVYCEGDNVHYYNLIDIVGIEFWALRDSRAIYYAAKNEKDKFSLRDRDFLTSNEIKLLTNEPYFTNYFILEYYCFENYLYHPDNISEVIADFDKAGYVREITKQKNDKIDSIIQDYKLSRLGYTDFNDNDKKNMDSNPELEIVASLKSNDFETFYKFFDMAGKRDKGFKKSFNREFLSDLNLDKETLAKTNWFKTQLSQILSKII